ncbi:MAG: hypothetical protein JWM33_1696 [Caulobacteraceae bacterium]|nr:hypothetical protein [Caulobacteraceae bacterium]
MMDNDFPPQTYVAFAGGHRLANGPLAQVAVAVRRAQDADPQTPVLVFNRANGRVVDLDLRGTEAEIVARLTPASEPAKRGRPKLGVTAREVTLLPRHWEWLAAQPGGASVVLRRLVEAARKADDGPGEARARTEAAYRFMSAMAGNLAGFEEASRALFAGERGRLESLIGAWPGDLRDEVSAYLGA